MLKKNWKKYRSAEILLLINDDLNRTDIVKHAYAMAYVTLFSLIPSLAATFALVSLFIPLFGKNSYIVTEVENFVLKNLAMGSGQQVIDYLEKFIANTDFQKIGITGFAGTVLTLILLLKQIELALNRIFEIDRPRALLIRFIYFWTFLTLGTFGIALSIGTITSSGLLSKYFSFSISLMILGDALYFSSIFALFFLLYKVVPNRFIPLKHSIIGSATSTILLSLAIKFFSLYISHFTSFQAIYGALSALPIFLFWLYVTWFITLFGAVITKRSMDGWHQEDLKQESIHFDLKDSYFQSLLPFLTLLAIYNCYENKPGEGALPEQISHEFGVSLSAVRRALHLLQESGLIISLQAEETSEFSSIAFFPRLPAQQLTYLHLKKKLLGDEKTWLTGTSLPQGAKSHYAELVQHYLTGSPHSLAEDLKF